MQLCYQGRNVRKKGASHLFFSSVIISLKRFIQGKGSDQQKFLNINEKHKADREVKKKRMLHILSHIFAKALNKDITSFGFRKVVRHKLHTFLTMYRIILQALFIH